MLPASVWSVPSNVFLNWVSWRFAYRVERFQGCRQVRLSRYGSLRRELHPDGEEVDMGCHICRSRLSRWLDRRSWRIGAGNKPVTASVVAASVDVGQRRLTPWCHPPRRSKLKIRFGMVTCHAGAVAIVDHDFGPFGCDLRVLVRRFHRCRVPAAQVYSEG